MKNILDYYYHFAHISLHYHHGVYSFEKEGAFYLFKEATRSIEELRTIYQLLRIYPSHYHQIVLNKDGDIITVVDQKPYILLKVSVISDEKISVRELLSYEHINQDDKSFSLLRRRNWGELWSHKIDYFEYQVYHIEKKYPLLAASFHYYVGLAENAISYVEDTKRTEKKEARDSATFSHIRLYSTVSITNYYDPFTIILDHPARDIAGYLKSLFWDDFYEVDMVYQLLQQIQFSRYGYRLLMARLLYPSYYFDLYEQILLGVVEESQIKKVLARAEEYRKYLRMIYQTICEIVEIPKIDWI